MQYILMTTELFARAICAILRFQLIKLIFNVIIVLLVTTHFNIYDNWDSFIKFVTCYCINNF